MVEFVSVTFIMNSQYFEVQIEPKISKEIVLVGPVGYSVYFTLSRKALARTKHSSLSGLFVS
jgi:hypothetical protein